MIRSIGATLFLGTAVISACTSSSSDHAATVTPDGGTTTSPDGESPASSEGGASGTGDWRATCASYAKVACDYGMACEPFNAPWTTLADCRAETAKVCLETFGKSPVDPASYKTCVDGRDALGPQCVLGDGLGDCLEVAVGLLPVGAPCVATVYVNSQIVTRSAPATVVPRCAHGRCAGNGTAHCGSCEAAKPVGASCGTDEECDLSAGDYCVSQKCQPFLKEGESCSAQGSRCDPRVAGLTCDGTTCIVLPQKLGAACTYACGGTMYCPPTTNVCTAPLGNGVTCVLDPPSQPVRYNGQCDNGQSFQCIEGTSKCGRLYADLGAPCGTTQGFQCFKSFCSSLGQNAPDGTCVAFAKEGESCNTTGMSGLRFCDPLLTCTNGTCVAPPFESTCP